MTVLVRKRTVNSLNLEDLKDLFEGRILAIKIPNFSPPNTCRIMAERIQRHNKLKYYSHAPNIARVMEAFYESYQNPVKRKGYYRKAIKSIIEFRQISDPYLNPMDHLRLLLDDIWEQGAKIENIDGMPMTFGLAQIFKKGSQAYPHQDFLKMDEPDNNVAQTLITQMTALVYVQPAISGGYLELWHEHYEHEEFMKRKRSNSYGLDNKKIPPPGVRIKPKTGELVIANSTKVHAVSKVLKGDRIAVNCFLGFRGKDKPITFWS